ncbi:acetyltransferase [Syntrophus gentianae]|uniref:Acetyltransferase n=1 Tax=Syntrophus gentianae TaxID=43775 RepID=A0A1H7Z989_9BACT|nr:acetate--CoA ligase family protein [Syntrophus gentianae]SEM54564.1 acetyltransferase [Syntrophus gentianae]
MRTFFYPESMVVVGASPRKKNLGHLIILNNVRLDCKVRLYGLSSEEGEIAGIHVYKDFPSLPEIPDVALFITPAAAIPDLLEECGKRGIRHVVIESSGFSEFSRDENDALEEKILKIAERYGIRFVGPNCIGIVNYDLNLVMPFLLYKKSLPGGRVGMISQSGGLGHIYLETLPENAVRPGKMVSVGNKLQIDETDFLQYFLEDEATDMVVVYLEGFKRGRDFFRTALSASKPIILQKSNRNPLSASIARSHTAALSASDDVVDGFCRQAAVIRVEDEQEAISAVKILQQPLMRGRRLAVLSRSGGHAVITADACSQYGFDLVPFPESFFERLNTLYTRRVIAPQNPLDLGEIFDYRIYARIMEEALKLDEVDGVLFNHVYQSHYESDMSKTFLGELDSLVRKYNKPAAVAVITDAAETLELMKSFPVYTSPLAAVKALNLSATYAERKELRDARGEGNALSFALPELQGRLAGFIEEKRHPLADECIDLLRTAGLSFVRSIKINQASDLEAGAVSFPVAVKLLSSQASHKSDVGGVRLNLPDRDALAQALSAIRSSVSEHAPGVSVEGFLVQEMAPEGQEFFVGGRQDPVFGPVVVAGLGGIFLEIFRDSAVRIAPVTPNEARDMLRGLHAWPILQGRRGQAPRDVEALTDLICRVAALLVDAPQIAEIDLNPVFVHAAGRGISLADARILMSLKD